VPVDDPELDPVWETCARLQVPVLIHTGEPAPFFEPVDVHNERWLELQVHPDRRRPAGQFPVVRGAHGRARPAVRAGTRRPRSSRRTWAFTPTISGASGRCSSGCRTCTSNRRHPRGARAAATVRARVLRAYQDRVLFGKDAWAPSEYPYFWRTFETADEYFEYYRDYHAFWRIYGMDLPDVVLRSSITATRSG
jgi:uncharacterized protein